MPMCTLKQFLVSVVVEVSSLQHKRWGEKSLFCWKIHYKVRPKLIELDEASGFLHNEWLQWQKNCFSVHMGMCEPGFIGFYSAPWIDGSTREAAPVLKCNVHVSQTMLQFRCCGADGPADWSTSVGWEKHEAVPDSCCVVKSDGCGQDKEKAHQKVCWDFTITIVSSNVMWTNMSISWLCAPPQGCIWQVKLFLLKNMVWVGGVCIALGVAEVNLALKCESATSELNFARQNVRAVVMQTFEKWAEDGMNDNKAYLTPFASGSEIQD